MKHFGLQSSVKLSAITSGTVGVSSGILTTRAPDSHRRMMIEAIFIDTLEGDPVTRQEASFLCFRCKANES